MANPFDGLNDAFGTEPSELQKHVEKVKPTLKKSETEDVKQDYERAITELDKARTLADIDRPQIPWWADPCGNNVGVRSHRIPQYYNGVNGKGLDGFWVDSAAEEGTDFRTPGINSQNNNNVGSGGGGIPQTPQQPTEDGGVDQGGSQQP